MIHQFLKENRETILALAREKTAVLAEERPHGEEAGRALPQFYDHLARELEKELRKFPARHLKRRGPEAADLAGRTMSPLGYSVSQVVHGYGVLGQAIAELARTTKAPISAGELRKLDLSVDAAIAQAVTERIGYLVHELRNALAAATVAHSMVKKGIAGTATNALLERNLNRMRDLLDHSFSAMRMQHGKVMDRQPLLVGEIIEEVRATASEEARLRGLILRAEIDSEKVIADRHYLISAVSNLVQNAIKYSRKGGVIWIRSRTAGNDALIEVEDECGGLPAGRAEELFQPFIQKNAERSGLGLGLTISRQAVELNGGTLAARDIPGKGCVFTIALPMMRGPAPPVKARAAGRHKR